MKRFFHNQFIWFFSGMLVISLISCSTPIGKFIKGQKKVDNINKEISQNNSNIVKKASSYNFAADFALSLDNAPTKYNQVAKEFTSRNTALLGTPELEELNQMKEIVNDLLSTNEILIVQGQKALKEKDGEIIQLQEDNQELTIQLGIKEEKLQAVNQENAQLATTWQKLKHSFWWIVWIVGGIWLLSTISKLLPPPYNSISSIFEIPISIIMKFLHWSFPLAKQAAGVVGKEYKEALTDLTLAVQKVKEQNPTIHSQISSTIAATVNDSSASVINTIKSDNKIVS